MTSDTKPKRPTKAEAIANCAQIYGAALADPVISQALRKHREQRAAIKRETEDQA